MSKDRSLKPKRKVVPRTKTCPNQFAASCRKRKNRKQKDWELRREAIQKSTSVEQIKQERFQEVVEFLATRPKNIYRSYQH